MINRDFKNSIPVRFWTSTLGSLTDRFHRERAVNPPYATVSARSCLLTTAESP